MYKLWGCKDKIAKKALVLLGRTQFDRWHHIWSPEPR